MRRSHLSRFGGLAAVLALLAGIGGVRGQPPKEGPVERLAEILRQTQPDTASRERLLQKWLGDRYTCVELYRAWSLSGWREARPGDAVAEVDQKCRRRIGERFLDGVKADLNASDPVVAAAMAGWLVEIAGASRSTGARPVLLRHLGADLVGVLKRDQPESRVVAIRALAVIEPDPAIAAPVFAFLLRSRDLDIRRGAAAGLGKLVATALQSMTWATGDAVKGARVDLVSMAAAVVPAARHGLDDPDVAVRQHCASVLRHTALALNRLAAGPMPADLLVGDRRAANEEALALLQPLVERLRDQGATLARAVRDEDTEVRLLACNAVEDLAEARWHWLRQAGRTVSADNRDDPLRLPLRAVLPGLASGAGDDEVRIRRAALDALEMIGPDATPAVPSLARALHDPDRSVRRTAVRVLGGLGPVVARAVVGELAALLEDPDPDMALAAVLAMQRIVPHAPPEPGMLSVQDTALPALVRSLRFPDATMRVAVLQTLRGLNASPAVPAVCEVLGDPDPRVRKAAAETLGAVGPAARAAVDPLRRALADASPEVREAARAALQAIRPTQR
jgi:HEAT repeat protein